MTLFRFAARLTVAFAAVASATLRWVDRTPTNFEDAMTAAGILVAIVMVASIVADFRLPLTLVEVAAALAVVLFTIDGAESILSQEQREVSIVRTACFTAAGAIIALAVMLDQHRRRAGAP